MDKRCDQPLTGTSSFEERRRSRRAKMILELTADLIRNDSHLTHREARSLVDCARKAIGGISPEYHFEFDARIAPDLERIIRDRWPVEELPYSAQYELVN